MQKTRSPSPIHTKLITQPTAVLTDLTSVQNETELPTEELISPKNNSTSIIWRWFECETNDYTLQNMPLKVTKSRSTTNLFHHVKQHPVQYEECIELYLKKTV